MPSSVPVGDPRLVVTYAQLMDAGVTPARIRAQVRARRWQRCGYAIVMHNGPLTRDQTWKVARAHAGPRALLMSFTAAEASGLKGWARDSTHLLVPMGTRCSLRCPVPTRLHYRRDWDSVRTAGATVLHRCADALVVAASSFESPRPACGILAAGVQQRLVRPADLRAVLAAQPKARHRAALAAAIEDIAQGAQALSEIDFVRLCRNEGLPPPEQQAVRKGPGGRRRYLDATWRRSDGRLVVVEVDGALHLDARRWWEDQERQNDIVLGGAIVLRFPSVVIRTRPKFVADQLRRALGLPGM